MDSKWILTSKTFWVAVLMFLLAMIVELTPVLKADNVFLMLKIFSYATPIIMVSLRFLTSTPVTLKKPDA